MSATASVASGRRTPSLVVVVVAGSVITALALGARSTMGLYLVPITESIGVSRGTFAFAIAVQNLIWGLSQPIAGAIADRYGSARVLAVGGVLYAGGLLLMSSATTGSELLLSNFVIGAATGAASFAVVLAAIGRMAPPEKRSLALGVATAMGSVGQFLLIPLTRALLNNNSWQTTMAVLAVITASLVLFTPAIRGKSSDQQRPEEQAPIVPLRDELRRAASSRSYGLLNGAFFVCGFHVTFIATHLPAYVDDVGLQASSGDIALMLIGLFNVFGSLAAGALGGRYSKTKLLSGIYLARAVVITAFVILPTSATATIVFGAAMGVLWLSTVPLTSGIVTSQFGTAHAGTLFGIVFLSHQLGSFAGAWMGGQLADSTGSYLPSWWIAVALGVTAAILHLLIDEGPVPEPPPRLSGGGVRIAPSATAAVVALAVGSAAAIAPSRAEAGSAAAADDSRPPFICIVGGH